MSRKDNWAADWICKQMSNSNDFTISPLTSNIVEISIKGQASPVKVATISVDTLDKNELEEVCEGQDIEFVLNIKKDVLITECALNFSQFSSIGLGGVGDLYRAINEKNFRRYLPKETKFILRGLRQHTKVKSVKRINNRKYRIIRHHLEDLVVLALNDYDLTAESVRSGLEKFGWCDIILASNPNSRFSEAAIVAAGYSEVEVLKWSQLLGHINQ